MPELADREKQEQELLILLMLVFDDARRQAERGQVNWAKFENDVQSKLQNQLAAIFLLAAFGMAAKHGGGAKFDVSSAAGSWASGYARGVARDVTQVSQQRLGEGQPPTAVFSQPRAESVAVTETTTAITRGEAEVAGQIESQTGDILEPFWRTARDAKVCPTCGHLDRTPQDVWGGDFPAGPPAHPHCRCYLEYKTLARGLA